MNIKIPVKKLHFSDFTDICRPNSRIKLDNSTIKKIASGENIVKHLMKNGRVVYGVNTGIGDLCDTILEEKDLRQLQENIILSHACGSGPYLNEDVARGTLFLVINARSKGFSGISPDTIRKLVILFNKNISPLLPSRGSLGASGDLIPLAHLALPLLSKGDVYVKGKITSASTILENLKLIPHSLKPKEALSLINGTEVSTSQAAITLAGAENLIVLGTRVNGILFEVTGASTSSLNRKLHDLKPHKGQVFIADKMQYFLKGSKLLNRSGKKVQDSYVIRCAPQVDGAIYDQIINAEKTVEIEMNSVTDNPLFFNDKKIEALSGGNFHAQNVAFSMDSLGIALTTYSKIMERRVERVLNTTLSGLAPFLIENSGLNAGLMIPHYLISSLIAENSVLAHPASIQSIPVSAGQEDFVSMSMTAANKADQILHNCEIILAIKLLIMIQAMDIMKIKKDILLSSFSPSAKKLHTKIRSHIPYIKRDRWIAGDIEKITDMINSGELNNL